MKYNVVPKNYGIVLVEPLLQGSDKEKVEALSRPDLTITVQASMEVLEGNSYYYQYGAPETPKSSSVLLECDQWGKVEQLAAEIKNVLNVDE